jgi:hypothetical protein
MLVSWRGTKKYWALAPVFFALSGYIFIQMGTGTKAEFWLKVLTVPGTLYILKTTREEE